MKANLISSFANELEKDAAVPHILRRLWRSGGGRALAGGALGAGTGALADPENRLRGAVLGGAAGAGGGYVAPLLTRAGRKRALESAKYRGRRLKHEITGKGPVPAAPGMKQKELAALRKQEALGLTSVPGVVKGLATRPLSTLKGAWQHSGRWGKVMPLIDVSLGVPHILEKDTPQSTVEKTLGTLGTSTGYMLGGRMGLLGSLALGSGLGYLTGGAGRLISGRRKVPGQEGSEGLPSRPSTVFAKQRLGEAVPEVGRLVGPG
jgi:hypothetical protein